MSKRLSLEGARFGRLKWRDEAPTYIAPCGASYRCGVWDCDCGSVLIARVGMVVNGNTRSCGCLNRDKASQLNKTHGMSKTTEYTIWQSMHDRCFNPNSDAFKNYGGRGITVCERWHRPLGFVNFTQDMGPRPAGKMLERRDNNGPYSPENCYWATRLQQNRNSRHNRVFTVFGVTGCVTELCDRFHVPYWRAYGRIKLGWPAERVFS